MQARTKRTKTIQEQQYPLAWVPEAKQTEELIAAMDALEEAGFRPTAYKQLYLGIIDNASHAHNLMRCIQALTRAGFHGGRFKAVYADLIANAAHAYQLAAAFKDLYPAGLFDTDNTDIVTALLQNAQFAFVTASTFRSFQHAELYDPKYKEMYLGVIKRAPQDSQSLAWAADTLAALGFTGDVYRELFKKIADQGASVMYKLAPALHQLKDSGFSISDDVQIFVALIDNLAIANQLAQAFTELKKTGFDYDLDEDLYVLVIDESKRFPSLAHQIVAALQQLNAEGYFDSYNEDLFRAAILAPTSVKELINDPEKCDFAWLLLNHARTVKLARSINAGLVDYVFTELKGANLQPREHIFLYVEILNQINISNSIGAVKLLNQVCNTVMQYPHKSNKRDLEQVIQDTLNPKLRYGPLYKSSATYMFETLLEQIGKVNQVSKIKMKYDENSGYTISLPHHISVNISLLLQYANLSHICLSDDLISKLDRIIRKISPHHYANSFYMGAVDVDHLTDPSKRAVYWYTTERYKNINRIFRGEELSDKAQYGWVYPVHSSNSYLANFLCGCLINDAANKLEPLKNKRVKGAAKSMYITLDEIDPELSRGERVSAELKKRRLANVLRTPSITSFSHFRGGSQHFHQPGTTHTKLKGDYAGYPVINEDEGEIIFAHGEQIEYHESHDGGFFARLVRSPDHQRAEGYLAGLALQHAYQQHLIKPYKESYHSTTINGVSIARPNHGLAHTYRVMMNIPHLINYFAMHALDEGFKQFCQHLSESERELLCVAAAFSITGRESEIAAGEDLSRYDKYRKASEDHFRVFLENHAPKIYKPDKYTRRRFQHIVRYMGNPWYEQHSPDGEFVMINCHPDKLEREHRNHLHRLLTIAHKLDLPRCYSSQQFHASMAMCRALSDEQLDTQHAIKRSDYLKLIQYNIELIKAHGNMLQFDIAADGSFVERSSGYKAPFDEVSQSMKRLYEISETVPLSIVTFDQNGIVSDVEMEEGTLPGFGCQIM